MLQGHLARSASHFLIFSECKTVDSQFWTLFLVAVVVMVRSGSSGGRWVSYWPGIGIELPVKPNVMTLIKIFLQWVNALEGFLWQQSFSHLSLSPPLPSGVCRTELRGCGRRRANMLSSLSPRPTSTRTRGCLATQSRQPFKSLSSTNFPCQWHCI